MLKATCSSSSPLLQELCPGVAFKFQRQADPLHVRWRSARASGWRRSIVGRGLLPQRVGSSVALHSAGRRGIMFVPTLVAAA